MFFVSTAEFLELTNKELVDYISGDDVNVDSEDTVLEAVLNWVKHDPDKRKPSLSAILEEARLQFCTGHYLRKVVDSCEVLTPEAQMYIRMALKFHTGTDRSLGETCHSSPGAPTSYRMKRHLLVVDARCTANVYDVAKRCVWYCDDGSWSWKVLTDLPQSVDYGSSTCVLNDGLVLTDPHGNCWKFHFQNKEWVKLPSMNSAYDYHRSVVGGCAIYAVGRTTTDDASIYVQRLDHNDREWSSLPNVPDLQPVADPLVVACDRGFYMFDNSGQSLCTQFYTIGGEWLTRAAMPEKCVDAAAVMLNGHIYVVGGECRSCERYNPATNRWQQLSRPDKGSRHAVAGVWHGRVLLAKEDINIYPLASKPSKAIMQYDPVTDQWSEWETKLPCKWSCVSMFGVDL